MRNKWILWAYTANYMFGLNLKETHHMKSSSAHFPDTLDIIV